MVNKSAELRSHRSRLDAQLTLSNASLSLITINSESKFDFVADNPRSEITIVVPNGKWQPAQACFDISDKRTRASNLGSLVLRPRGAPLRAFGNATGSAQILICAFDNDYFVETSGLRDWNEQMLGRCSDLQSRIVNQLMQRMFYEVTTEQLGSVLAVESLANLVLIEIGRFFAIPKSIISSPRRLAPWQIRKIEECLRETVDDWPSLTELAELCGISAKYLSRAFSETVGISLSKFSEQIRIERAKTLLAESRLTIKQVAGILGFANANYFSTAFHRVTGETAREYIGRQ